MDGGSMFRGPIEQVAPFLYLCAAIVFVCLVWICATSPTFFAMFSAQSRAEIVAFTRSVRKHYEWWITFSTVAFILTLLQWIGVMIPHWIIWTWIVCGIVVAAFLSWRDEHRELRKFLTPSVNFVCLSENTVFRVQGWHNNSGLIFAEAFISFQNWGNATAYNPAIRVYQSWLDKPQEIDLILIESVTTVPTTGGYTGGIHVCRPERYLGRDSKGLPIRGLGRQDRAFFWIQIQWQNQEGEIQSGGFHRFVLRPPVLRILAPHPKEVAIAQLHFENFRNRELEFRSQKEQFSTTPLLQGLDIGEPQRSEA